MRLIDADKWIKDLTEAIKNTSPEYQDIFCLFISEIRKRPTAYDVVKVISRLTDDARTDISVKAVKSCNDCLSCMRSDIVTKHINIMLSELEKGRGIK